MFAEPHYINKRSGSLEVICGSMFSGKTEELIRRLKRAKIANQNAGIFKPQKDSRYHQSKIVTHDDLSIKATALAHSRELLSEAEKYDVIGIDEAQFFDTDLPHICYQLIAKGLRIIVAGLDMDYLGHPFHPIPELLAMADYVTKVHAICVHCGSLAVHSYRLVDESKKVLVGAQEAYEPRCRHCFQMGNILDLKTSLKK